MKRDEPLKETDIRRLYVQAVMQVDRTAKDAGAVKAALEGIVKLVSEFEGDPPEIFTNLIEIYEAASSKETNGVVTAFYDLGRRYKLI